MEQTTNGNAVQTRGLGKRYKSFWALRDCTISVPSGSISALVGPNGAGKTTLLKLLVGLNGISSGDCTVIGQQPSQEASYIAEIGYVAQDIPLYKQLTVMDHLQMGAHLNRRWDMQLAQARLRELRIPFDRQVAKLSGGQKAQVGLALALAKQPSLLLLDEPVAALDPLAREEFLSSLAKAVTEADGKLTVVMSSHLLGDLERICDHLIILANAKTQLCNDIEMIVKTHKLLIGAATNDTTSAAYDIIEETRTARQINLLVRLKEPSFTDSRWQMHEVNIEEIVLAYMKQARKQEPTERSKQ